MQSQKRRCFEPPPANSTANRGGSLSRFPFRPFQSREPLHRTNGKIRAREIRVIDENKQSLGVMPLNAALRMAQEKGLDLIEIAPTATPPVCRIMDYGKFRYEESKREKQTHHRNRLKEIQLSAVIDPHDFGVKLAHAIEFLCDDIKVRLKLRFKGRQKAHKEYGFEVMNRFVREAAPYGHADSPPKMLGDRDLNVLLTPLPKDKRAKNPRATKAPETESSNPASEASSQADDDSAAG
jgi:translation initiation factor IF-3